VIGTASSGDLYHTIRYADKHWLDWDNLSTRVGKPASMYVVACAGIGRDLHFVATTGTDTYHTIGDANGHWQSWGKMNRVPGNSSPGLVSCASVGCGNCTDLHVLDAMYLHIVSHSIRFINKWQPWDSVFNKIANYPGDPNLNLITYCTGVGNVLHVVGIDGGGGSISGGPVPT